MQLIRISYRAACRLYKGLAIVAPLAQGLVPNVEFPHEAVQETQEK